MGKVAQRSTMGGQLNNVHLYCDLNRKRVICVTLNAIIIKALSCLRTTLRAERQECEHHYTQSVNRHV